METNDKITSLRLRESTRNLIDEYRNKDESFEQVLLKIIKEYHGNKYTPIA